MLTLRADFLPRYDITSRITAQASRIWSSVMIKGGAMRMELSQNRNQSVITPRETALSMMGFSTSKESNSTANHNLNSIAFPNISTGIYGYPKNKAAGVTLAAVQQFLETETSIEEIVFVCFDDENYRLYEARIGG